MKAKPKSETVKVAVRVRPMNNREKEEKSIQCVEVDREQNQVSVSDTKHETKTFQFDYVYDMNSTQREVYDQVAFPIVDSIFQGYNGTIFAYGQTGCGKTFTMMGVVNDPVLKGVVPNAFDHIFGYINAEGSSKKFLIRCSFVEIYNEEVRDGGGTPTKALEVREDPKKGTYVKGLSFTPGANTKEIEKCLDRGNNNRHVGVTSMNDQSSRSHSLFTVYVEIEEGIDDKNKKIRSGKLNLVDLAGSERVGKTNATGQTFDEGKKINLSLTAGGSVIDAGAANRKHIPYKDSKLTRGGSDSLGGNTKTVMFANCSPASFNYEETVGTLRYASRAKLIKNAPKINEDPKDAGGRQYEEQIKMGKEQLEGKLAPPNEDRFKEAEEEEDNADRGEEKPKVQRKQSNIENGDPAEKRALLEKIAAGEKEMISGGTKGNTDEGKKEIRKDEQDKFKQYRLQQLKNVDEMEKKLAGLEETKRKEEESGQNDVTKLKKRIKYGNTEIEDGKYDNEKDRTDFLENIKGYNKDIKGYRGIIGYLLTDWELRKIIDMSSYNDETETWKIHPFTIREKTLQLPNVKPSQVPVLIEGEINSREGLGHDQPADERPNRFNDNYSNYRDNRDNKDNKKHKYKINEDVGLLNTNKNNYNQPSSFECNGNKYPNNNINNINIHNNQNQALSKQMRAREKVGIDGSKHNITTKRQSNNNLMKSSEDRESVHSNNSSNSKVSNGYNPPIIHSNTSNTTNINMGILNKKERERFEELMKYGNSNMSNVNSSLQGNGATNAMGTGKPLKKGGKYILDPIKPNQLGSNPNNNGKLEGSFKATLEISDNSGNKIEISPNVNGKRKYKLDRINEGNES